MTPPAGRPPRIRSSHQEWSARSPRRLVFSWGEVPLAWCIVTGAPPRRGWNTAALLKFRCFVGIAWTCRRRRVCIVIDRISCSAPNSATVISLLARASDRHHTWLIHCFSTSRFLEWCRGRGMWARKWGITEPWPWRSQSWGARGSWHTRRAWHHGSPARSTSKCWWAWWILTSCCSLRLRPAAASWWSRASMTPFAASSMGGCSSPG